MCCDDVVRMFLYECSECSVGCAKEQRTNAAQLCSLQESISCIVLMTIIKSNKIKNVGFVLSSVQTSYIFRSKIDQGPLNLLPSLPSWIFLPSNYLFSPPQNIIFFGKYFHKIYISIQTRPEVVNRYDPRFLTVFMTGVNHHHISLAILLYGRNLTWPWPCGEVNGYGKGAPSLVIVMVDCLLLLL